MDIRCLETIILVAKCRGFSNAESQISYTQSAISKQVRAVENEFNVRIFNRDARHFGITPEGEVFLKYAEEIVDSYNKLTKAMQMAKMGETGSVSIGFTTKYAGSSGEKELASGFVFAYPEVDVATLNLAGGEVMPLVDSGKIDVGLVILCGYDRRKDLEEKYSIVPYQKGRIKFAVGKGHRLYDHKGTITMQDLASEKIFLPSFTEPGFEEYGLSSRFDIICRQSGISPNIVRRSEYGGVRALYAAKGMVVPFCAKVAKDEYRDIRFLYLEDDPCKANVWAVCRKNNITPTIKKFLDYIKKQYDADPGEPVFVYE